MALQCVAGQYLGQLICLVVVGVDLAVHDKSTFFLLPQPGKLDSEVLDALAGEEFLEVIHCLIKDSLV